MNKVFQRTKEDFTCEHCGETVVGDGYTNHCPKCLWSKHVDVHPGDRDATCNSLMEPIRVEQEGKEYKIVHRCTDCGHKKRNKVAPDDNFEILARL